MFTIVFKERELINSDIEAEKKKRKKYYPMLRIEP